MLARIVDRLASRWLEHFKHKRGLQSASPITDELWTVAAGQRSFLHVGCGNSRKPQTVPGFMGDDWREIRLDADAAVEPDIVASMTDMRDVPDEAVDAIFSSHNIEHLYPHEVPVALAEFHRVLKPDGFLVLTCPDLQSLCRLVVDDKLDDTAYISPAGPIAPIDVLYGHRPPMAAGNLYMAHRCGFTLRTLMAAAQAAGFLGCYGLQRERNFDLWLMAHKDRLTQNELAQADRAFLPLPS